jgi:penicillin-binding protein 1B
MKKAALGLVFILCIFAGALGFWLHSLDQNIAKRFAEKRFIPPVEFYSAPEKIKAGSRIPASYFMTLFERRHFRSREFGQPLQNADYSVWTEEQCRSLIPNLDPSLKSCIAFRHEHSPTQLIAFANDGLILGIWAGSPLEKAAEVELEPELFAQYYGDKAILRSVVPLGEAPANCLQALLAIEDSHFLEHSGVSVTGLLRAFLKDLRSGKVEQGGSTITQQLVKNYFLSQERTVKRKVTELAMALLLENRVSKDDILETYINLIYLGQNGSFEIRGFGAAAEHYFQSDLENLNLPQCALLAAMVASPGQFNPFQHPDKAQQRRSKVLNRMLDLGWITPSDEKEALNSPLPVPPKKILSEPAPYFVQAIRKELQDSNLDESDGLKVYTTLNLRAQEAAQRSVEEGLKKIESQFKNIQKLKKAGKNLESLLVSADPETGEIQALVGGRSYSTTQFNRAVDGHRQVGSIMKPLVYLTALESNSPDGAPYTPLTILNDEPFIHDYQGQSWSPKNYGNEYFGKVPMFFALKESLNAATASLGLAIGLDKIITVARRLGIESRIEAFPALTLGAFELYPREVLQAYSIFAKLGKFTKLKLFTRIESNDGKVLLQNAGDSETRIDPIQASILVGMMRQTLLSGTARSIVTNGFKNPAAGKTGTTNDKKDAWFAGFTPYHVAVVWVGYDDNTPHNLTGASGAVPIWTDYMKDYGATFPATEFPWSPGTEVKELSISQLKDMNLPIRSDRPTELVFRK